MVAHVMPMPLPEALPAASTEFDSTWGDASAEAPVALADAAAGADAAAAQWSGCIGRLIEISGQGNSARSSYAAALLAAAQCQGELAAWVEGTQGGLYPPDLAACGIDLAALAAIRVPAAAGPHGRVRAAELLLQSGAFGCVVVDLLAGAPPRPEIWQGRLLRLVRLHQGAVLLLTDKPASACSAGPLIGQRLQPERRDIGTRGQRLQATWLKNKAAAPPWPACLRRGPEGLG